jgi:gluconate 2-dehydrogenase alpha chain
VKTLPKVDIVIIGGGWSGLLMAKELGARTPHSIVVLERGGPRSTASYSDDMDELDYAIRNVMMQDLSKETVTLRHATKDIAQPLRQHGAFLPGNGVGGAGEHWNGLCERLLPDAFQLLSKTTEKYGAKKLPANHAIIDWGVTYDELEPYYTRADQMLGVSGKAGNLRGKKIDGGNIFEGPRSADYPTPPIKSPYFSSLVRDGAKSLGLHPYVGPAANLSVEYTNPDGISRPPCAYCGFCERFGCMIGAKAQPSNVLLPVIQRHKNVVIRTGATVWRIEKEAMAGNKTRARGVTYQQEDGEEIFLPAELVILSSWTMSNTRLLLLSKIGEAYDPSTGKGSVGRNLTHQVNVSVTAFFDKPLNSFMGAGAATTLIPDFNGDLFDHSELPFIRGGTFQANSHGDRPIASFGVVPRSIKSKWGSEWKKAALQYYDHSAHMGFLGEHLPYKDNYFDLDPTYKDVYGDPLLRLTLNWHENERKMVDFGMAKATEIVRAAGAAQVTPFATLGDYDSRRYQSTHVQGGTVMGTSPEHSVVNPYLQQWQMPNLFVLGGSVFPQGPSAPPTLTILAQTIRTADAIIDSYLKKPGPLA